MNDDLYDFGLELAGEEIFARLTAQLFEKLVPESGRERSIGPQLYRHTSSRSERRRLGYHISLQIDAQHSSFRRISERAEPRTEREIYRSCYSLRFETAVQFRFTIIIAYQPWSPHHLHFR